MFGLGITELIIIAVILLFFFGAKRIPEIGKGIGGAIREFKNIKKEINGDKKSEIMGDIKNKKSNSTGIEDDLGHKLMKQTQEVKKAIDVKKKIDRIKEILW